MINIRFGKWVIIKETEKPTDYKHRGKWFLCRCDCGTQRAVRANSLKMGQSTNCGCYHREQTSKRMKENHPMYKHGQARTGKRTKEWRAWNAMIRRCKYPSMERYSRYGGRGIIICNQWLNSFEAFFNDIGSAPSKSHSIDRTDNNGNYEPRNVRWATNSEQIRNSEKTRLITFNRCTMTIGDWSKKTGINRQTIQMRLDKYNWSIQKALTVKPCHSYITSHRLLAT